MTAESPRRKALGRAQRIRRSGDFARIKQHGKRSVQGCLIANWKTLEARATSRLGVVTSRKVGGAVVRNRARRLLRETFRKHRHELAHPVDLVLVARPSMADKSFASVEKDFLTSLRKAGLLRLTAGE